MFSSLIACVRGAIILTGLLFFSSLLFAQDTRFENYELEPVLVNMSIADIDGKKAVRVSRDTASERRRYAHLREIEEYS
jgi:hypothetical protein